MLLVGSGLSVRVGRGDGVAVIVALGVGDKVGDGVAGVTVGVDVGATVGVGLGLGRDTCAWKYPDSPKVSPAVSTAVMAMAATTAATAFLMGTMLKSVGPEPLGPVSDPERP